MGWFRTQRFQGAAFALFALACQLVLSFGHVHLDPTANNGGYWPIAAASGKAAAAPSSETALTVLPTTHRQNDQNKAGQDFCAICASLSLGEHAGRSQHADAALPVFILQAIALVVRRRASAVDRPFSFRSSRSSDGLMHDGVRPVTREFGDAGGLRPGRISPCIRANSFARIRQPIREEYHHESPNSFGSARERIRICRGHGMEYSARPRPDRNPAGRSGDVGASGSSNTDAGAFQRNPSQCHALQHNARRNAGDYNAGD